MNTYVFQIDPLITHNGWLTALDAVDFLYEYTDDHSLWEYGRQQVAAHRDFAINHEDPFYLNAFNEAQKHAKRGNN